MQFDYDKFAKTHLETGKFADKFQVLGLIGKGGFGTVQKVRHKLEGAIYAIKKVRLHL